MVMGLCDPRLLHFHPDGMSQPLPLQVKHVCQGTVSTVSGEFMKTLELVASEFACSAVALSTCR